MLFCHDATRYVLFLPGLRAPQLAELGRWHRDLFLATLATQWLSDNRLARVELGLGSLRVAAQDLKFCAFDRTANVMELEPIVTSRWAQ